MINIFLILIVSIFTTVGAQLCLKKGVLALGDFDFTFSAFFYLISRIFQNLWLAGGVVLFAISFFLWIFVLSKLQLNIAYPIAIALNFSLITIASWFLFKEHLSLPQILGIVTIICGTFLVLFKG